VGVGVGHGKFRLNQADAIHQEAYGIYAEFTARGGAAQVWQGERRDTVGLFAANLQGFPSGSDCEKPAYASCTQWLVLNRIWDHGVTGIMPVWLPKSYIAMTVAACMKSTGCE
jgi:hypothetical protein